MEPEKGSVEDEDDEEVRKATKEMREKIEQIEKSRTSDNDILRSDHNKDEEQGKNDMRYNNNEEMRGDKINMKSREGEKKW